MEGTHINEYIVGLRLLHQTLPHFRFIDITHPTKPGADTETIRVVDDTRNAAVREHTPAKVMQWPNDVPKACSIPQW